MERNHICKKCGGIAGWDSYFQSWICTRCGNEEPKHVTNADSLRAMSDEELAKYLDSMQSLAYHNGVDVEPIRFYPNNYGAWLDWLRQEAGQDARDGS